MKETRRVTEESCTPKRTDVEQENKLVVTTRRKAKSQHHQQRIHITQQGMSTDNNTGIQTRAMVEAQ